MAGGHLNDAGLRVRNAEELLSASPSRDAFLLLGPDVLPLGVTDAGCCAAGPR